MQEDEEYLSNKRKEGPQDCFKWEIAIVWQWAWKGWIARGVKADRAIPYWKPGLGESYVPPQTRGLWKCRMGSTSGSLARLPSCCLCSVQQPLLILPPRARGAGAAAILVWVCWNPSLHSGPLQVACLSWCWAWAVSLRSVGPAYKCGSFGSSSLLLVSLGIMPWHQ